MRPEDYQDLTALIAQRETDREPSEPDILMRDVIVDDSVPTRTMSPEEEQLAKHIPWAEEDLARLAEGRTTTTERWTLAMDECVKVPEVYLGTSEVAKRSGMSISEWRDAPRKITRHLKAHFPGVPRAEDGEAQWPLCVGGKGIPTESGQVYWAITKEMATRWLKVRTQ